MGFLVFAFLRQGKRRTKATNNKTEVRETEIINGWITRGFGNPRKRQFPAVWDGPAHFWENLPRERDPYQTHQTWEILNLSPGLAEPAHLVKWFHTPPQGCRELLNVSLQFPLHGEYSELLKSWHLSTGAITSSGWSKYPLWSLLRGGRKVFLLLDVFIIVRRIDCASVCGCIKSDIDWEGAGAPCPCSHLNFWLLGWLCPVPLLENMKEKKIKLALPACSWETFMQDLFLKNTYF